MGHLAIVDLLLDREDTDVNHVTTDRLTALAIAAKEGHKEIVARQGIQLQILYKNVTCNGLHVRFYVQFCVRFAAIGIRGFGLSRGFFLKYVES
jgi:hypothetical protein